MPSGPSRSAGQESADVLHLKPVAAGGVNQQIDPALLGTGNLATSENLRNASGVLSRRGGAVKLYAAANPCGSKTFGTTGKYATIPADSQLIIPVGGWAFHASFIAARPSAGNTAWLLSSRPNGQTFHVLKVTLDENGVIVVGWRDSNGVDRSVSCTAVAADAAVHLLAVYDPVALTFTVYINGASSGTPLTGLSATLKPDQTSGVIWAVGVEKESSAAVTANTQFIGAIDSLTLFSLAGVRPSSGTTTLVATLLAHSRHQWPSPWMDMVLFNYDMDATGQMYDSSRYKNHATLVGAYSNTGEVAFATIPANYVGAIDALDGSRINIFGSAGRLFYERTRQAS